MNSITLLVVAVILIVLNCCSFSSSAVLTKESRQEAPKCVYLKNANFGEYLYTASTNYAIPFYGNRVFTWRRKEDGPGKDWAITQGKHFEYQAVWVIERVNKNSCHNCYTIKSAYYENNAELLYAVSSADHVFELARPRRPVYTYRESGPFPSTKGQHIWKIEGVPDYPDRIRIKDKNNEKLIDEYLYAADDDRSHDHDRRNVYTWSSKDDSDIDTWKGVGDWIMEKAVCPSYIK